MSNILDCKIGILYEDEDCLVVNKPAGIMVHADGRSEGPFLTDWIISKFPDLKGVGETQLSPEGDSLERPGIVHRLDKDTSGVLLIAKNPKSHAYLKFQFQERTVVKKYLAFVWGEFAESFGTINKPIGRSANHFPKWSAGRGTRGEMREAETYWTRIWTGLGKTITKDGEKMEKFSLIQAEPKTGRTHQIRVHMLAVQHPVVCDGMYAPKKPKALGFERLALHSRSIQFLNMKGQKILIKAPLPTDFEDVVTRENIKLPADS